jgi:hypothetical protein
LYAKRAPESSPDPRVFPARPAPWYIGAVDLREALDAIARRMADLAAAAAPAEVPDALDLAIGEAELDRQLATHRSGLLLGLWDEGAAERALEAGGVLAAIRARVGAPVRVRVDADEGLLRVHRADRPEGPDALLVEVKARLERVPPERLRRLGFPAGEVLAIDWILMQDPGSAFPARRGALPGQRHPGLGLGREAIGVFRRAAARLGAGAVLGIPRHYHAAAIYHILFAFADPLAEGRFQALARDLAGLPLAEAARAVEDGRVCDAASGEPLRWAGEEMVMPIAEPVRAYFADPRYLDRAARALAGARFRVA